MIHALQVFVAMRHLGLNGKSSAGILWPGEGRGDLADLFPSLISKLVRTAPVPLAAWRGVW